MESKQKQNLFMISITRILFTKGKKKHEKKEKVYKSKQMPHKYKIQIVIKCNTAIGSITFSGHFISFGDRKSFGAEIAKHLEVY